MKSAEPSRPPSPLRVAGLLLLLLAFAGCAASSKMAPPAPPAPTTTARLDASYDWHGLLLAPFGGRLKDFPSSLHEVLMFHDDAHPDAPADDAECYATWRQAPRFLEHIPDEYLLCFRSDRLARIEVTVRLPTLRAASILAAACELWLKNAQSSAGPVEAGPAPQPLPAAGAAGLPSCEGRDAGVAFSAHLDESTEAATPLILRLDSRVRP